MKTIIGILVGLCLATGANAQESETITITPVKAKSCDGCHSQ
jgi:hypothetical protein